MKFLEYLNVALVRCAYEQPNQWLVQVKLNDSQEYSNHYQIGFDAILELLQISPLIESAWLTWDMVRF